ncbi:hypothetical protein [Desulfoluna spongiiphila]|uniref:Uncharacterized protein n=1 Tax=Desulfoluna spongiiphila TaxID=419481 RepID=A0A1G5ET68_9BACT|nr:hypothetical protein [Desulfoluna spongiiphila]SCY30134.1 hypothetical protein SAMN05216233_106203 [Desulfoluna spongiiphila]
MNTPPGIADPNTNRGLLALFARLRLAEAMVFAYCLWHARDLLSAWQRSPHDRLGWLALFIWLVPVLYRGRHLHRGLPAWSPLLLGLGLLLSFIGEMGSLNLLNHLGLATALAGLARITPRQLPWAAAAISWMPLFGWVGSHWFPTMILPVRLALATAGCGFFFLHIPPPSEVASCPT